MKFKILIIVLIFSFANITTLYSQKNFSEKADIAFDAGQFYKSIDLYKYSYAKAKGKEEKAEIIYKTAICYRLINNSKQAEIWFKKAIRKGFPSPLAILYYADAMKLNGKYDEAVEQYQKYKNYVPDDTKADIGISSCQDAKQWIEHPTRYKVNQVYYFNSKKSDFCPAFGKSDFKVVFFTSSREGATGNKINDVTGQYYTDIFRSRVDRKGKWSEPVPLGKGVNSEYDEGGISLNLKANNLYYTSFRESKEGKLGCQIYFSKKQGIEWSKGEIIPIAPDSITVGHPAISSDELTLYFVSDMKGGKGGKDIWKITRESKTKSWGKAENLGTEINTSENEMFPYIHKDGTLYFSSDGLPGMGGLDIFEAVPTPDGKWKVENVKYPINSSYDDFGIVFEGDIERGYFSTNRKGGKGSDDIYQFYLPPIEFNIEGVVKNENTEDIIAGADINLIGSDGTNEMKKSEADGSFSFKLNPNTDYRVITKKGGFLNGKGKETTKGLTENKTFKLDIFMSPDDSRIVLPNILYDLGKWDLRPESLVSLEKLVEILNDNPNIIIEIGSHTDFRGGADYNIELSGKRAKSVVDFLITYGIDQDRLTSKGYGELMPKTIDKKEARAYSFLEEGDILNESYINNLPNSEQKEICHQINRRTDFGVTGRDYIPKIKKRGH
ncbi:MAG: OmpA family protein [Bacteroidales bacterium]|nr:OmpA family protein [Bacteroidales bacterium]